MAQCETVSFCVECFLVAKVQLSGKPVYLAERLKSDYKYNTRISKQNLIQWGPEFKAKKTLTHSSWRWCGSVNFNRIPQDLRSISDQKSFQLKLIQWVRKNVPM